MKRLFSLISKTPKTLTNTTRVVKSIPHKPPISPQFQIQNPNGYPVQQHFPSWGGCSRSFGTHTSCLMKCQGGFTNPVGVRMLLPSALHKNACKGVVGGQFGLVRARFSRGFLSKAQPYSRGWQSWVRRRLTTDGVVIGLIVTNVAVFLLWHVADRSFMVKNFTIQLDNFKSGRLHTMITSAFSHHDPGHLFSNMIGLYFFGTNIGRVFGPEFLLKLYFAGAFVGSVFYLVRHAFMAPSSKNRQGWGIDRSNIPGLGASGAVNAIMLLDIFLFPKNTIFLEFIIPVPAILLGVFLIGKDVLSIMKGDTQISGAAHLGGAAVAAVTWARMRRGRF